MGLGGISIWQLLIVLAIVLLLFGTKRLKGLGGDLGGAIKGFKKAIKDEEKDNIEQQKVSEEDTINAKQKNTESVNSKTK